jgi:high-affinity nickel-transport protein
MSPEIINRITRIGRSEIAVRAGRAYDTSDLDVLLNNRGLLARIFRSLFRLVSKGWHMLPLGVLFGLDFDTAIEIAMFGGAAAKGVSVGAILVFPVLFAAGISLIDTTDGAMMLGVYDCPRAPVANQPRPCFAKDGASRRRAVLSVREHMTACRLSASRMESPRNRMSPAATIGCPKQ